MSREGLILFFFNKKSARGRYQHQRMNITYQCRQKAPVRGQQKHPCSRENHLRTFDFCSGFNIPTKAIAGSQLIPCPILSTSLNKRVFGLNMFQSLPGSATQT